MSFTHFLSLPLVDSPCLREAVVRFQREVLALRLPGIEESARRSQRSGGGIANVAEDAADSDVFIDVRTLHLTVLMLRLESAERIEQACKLLEQVREPLHALLHQRALTVSVRGVAVFNTERGTDQSHVLYGNIHHDGRIATAGDFLRQEFAQFSTKKELLRPLTFHATLLKSRPKSNGRRIPFSTGVILERYADSVFAEDIPISSLKISILNGKKDQNGYYRSEGEIDLP